MQKIILCCLLFVNSALGFSQVKTIEQQNTGTYSLENGVQTILINLKARYYDPITVKKGIPVRFIIRADQKAINGCNNEIQIPFFKIRKKLVPGDNIIEFTPKEKGVIPYACWMNMIRSKITVID